MAHGEISPKNRLHLKITVGEALNDETNETFDLYVDGASYTPMVVCRRTRKTFILPWRDILRMAEEAGVSSDEPAPVEDPPHEGSNYTLN